MTRAGRVTSAYWPGSEVEPFSTFINDVAKHVATSTPLERSWPNATVIDGDVVPFVRNLKDSPSGDIGVHAGTYYPEHLAAPMAKIQDTILVCPTVASQVAAE